MKLSARESAALTRLAESDRLLAALEADIARQVDQLRQLRVSWEHIGAALNLSAAGVQYRYRRRRGRPAPKN